MTITSLAIFALALLPNLIALESVTTLGYLELVAVTVAVLALVDGGYVLMASRIGRLLRRPAALRWDRRAAERFWPARRSPLQAAEKPYFSGTEKAFAKVLPGLHFHARNDHL